LEISLLDSFTVDTNPDLEIELKERSNYFIRMIDSYSLKSAY